MKKLHFHPEPISLVLPLLLALICLLSVAIGNHQASLPIPMPQELIGEYSYDGDNWLPLSEDAPLSARKGDLLLRGHFLREMSKGWYLNFYCNHIGVTIYVNGECICSDAVSDYPGIDRKLFASMCAREWKSVVCPGILPEDAVEIRLHNPHRFGNRSAYREFLTTLCVDMPEWDLLEQNLESGGKPFRIVGSLLTIAATMLLGAAVAAVIRFRMGWNLLKMSLLTLFAGGFIAFDTLDISFWSQLNVLNTYTGQLCMMLAVFCLGHLLLDSFSGRRRKLAGIAVLFSALLNSVLILLSFTGVTVIYDTLPVWAGSQLLLCPLLMLCCLLELRCPGEKNRLMLCSGLLLFGTVLLDLAAVGANIVWRSPCSKAAFVILFAVHFFAASLDVLKNHRASLRAEKLEKELEDSRITIMLSQIKPHFLYNVLNTIYYLYRKEPETAQEAVSSFAEYLRCNMLSIEKLEPIPFSEEYRHIQTYLSLEQIRFRGKLDVVYDVEVTDFKLPPLTVEPLVENAVKHGVTKKRGGGSVTISTRRTAEGWQVSVADTGIGFDPEHYMEDGKPHVGIRNVRQRLQSMVGGSLSVTSSEEGTLAVVTIPAKELNRSYEDHSG